MSEHAAADTWCLRPTPPVSPEDPNYCEIYATEARTPNQAAGKIRPLAAGRRLHAYLATGKYKHELADARWVA